MASKTAKTDLVAADGWTQIATGVATSTIISVAGPNPVHIAVAAAEADIDTELTVGHRLKFADAPLVLAAPGAPIWARVNDGSSSVVVTQY